MPVRKSYLTYTIQILWSNIFKYNFELPTDLCKPYLSVEKNTQKKYTRKNYNYKSTIMFHRELKTHRTVSIEFSDLFLVILGIFTLSLQINIKMLN